jgi:hypothetical protein
MGDALPGAGVQVSDLTQQPDPVRVLEVEQAFEIPVEVVGEIGDLLPQVLVGVPAQPCSDPSR